MILMTLIVNAILIILFTALGITLLGRGNSNTIAGIVLLSSGVIFIVVVIILAFETLL